MKRVAFDIIFGLVVLLCICGCREEQNNSLRPNVVDDECVLLFNMGVAGLEMSAETKAAAGNWIQDRVGMTNIAIVLFDHDTGERVYSGAKYPFRLISTSSAYQLAWALGNFSPTPGKLYDLAFSSNFKYLAELNGFLKVDNLSDLVNPSPVSRTFQFIRSDMSNPTQVVDETGESVNCPEVEGYGGDNTMYVNQWRSPTLSGMIRGITLLRGGINVVGFKRDGSDYEPAVDLAIINRDLGTSYTSLPTLYDATEGETDNANRIMTISPCYAMVVVDGITNNTSGKLDITDIFMMNVPMCSHLFTDATYYFGGSGNDMQNAVGVTAYSSSKDLVSGFDPAWINSTFEAVTATDDFARLLHYPITNSVSLADFKQVYRTGTASNTGSYYFCPLSTGQLLDRLCVKKGDANDDFSAHMSNNWSFIQGNFGLKYVTKDVRKAPFFLINANNGEYPGDDTVDEDGNRQYLYATRLVIRGKWKDTPTSTEEIVYYPIIVNGPNQGYTASYDGSSPVEERETFVRNGRRYIYNITIEGKGVHNPWTASRVEVALASVELKVDRWIYVDVEIPKYIY